MAQEVRLITLDRRTADKGLVARGSIDFSAGDDLTTEKKTSTISASTIGTLSHDNACLVAIEKPEDATAGTLTVTVYNVIKIDGTNERDVKLTELNVANISGSNSYECFPVEGMFIGEGDIKLGAKFASDSGAITVKYAIYKY